MRNLKLFLLAALSIMANSCVYDDFDPDEWAIDPELTFSNSYVVFTSSIGSQTIKVSTNYSSFTVESADDWCDTSIDNDTTISISVESNESSSERATTVSVTVERGNKTLTKDISVVQFGGIWDMIGEFNVYWKYEVSDSQRDAIEEIIENLQYVKGGTFAMREGSDDEHDVTLSSFYISKYELTQKQWNAIMVENPSIYRGSDLPAENMSWTDAWEFVTTLSSLTNLDFSLPTEAQWEYAARGGQYSLNYTYPGSDDYTEVAHYVGDISEDNPLYTTIEGGTLLPNELGLYDMAGNVAEYCYDWYTDDFSEVEETEDPTGPKTGTYKVLRGGDLTSLYLYSCTSRILTSSVTKVYSTSLISGIRLVLNP